VLASVILVKQRARGSAFDRSERCLRFAARSELLMSKAGLEEEEALRAATRALMGLRSASTAGAEFFERVNVLLKRILYCSN
jgi:hypothetical protein